MSSEDCLMMTLTASRIKKYIHVVRMILYDTPVRYVCMIQKPKDLSGIDRSNVLATTASYSIDKLLIQKGLLRSPVRHPSENRLTRWRWTKSCEEKRKDTYFIKNCSTVNTPTIPCANVWSYMFNVCTRNCIIFIFD